MIYEYYLELCLMLIDTNYEHSHLHSIKPYVLVFIISHTSRTKTFVRWMHGSCLDTPPQKIPGEDELFLFSFFSDVSVTSDVSVAALDI